MNNNNNNNILIKPKKILGKGSEGIAIHANNNKYVIKIYNSPYTKNIMLLKILNYLESYKNLPKTIYKSYYFTKGLNSFNRYISNNSLPNYFIININKNYNNYKNLISKKKINNKLYEIMKYYKYTFEDFIVILNKNENMNIQKKINILYSFLQQGILTLIWLYMKKGIVHNDINYNNFFIQETSKEYIEFKIKDYCYKIKLEGYYLVIGDFGYAKSLELVSRQKFPEKNNSLIRSSLNPIYSIEDFIKLLKPRLQNNYNVNNIKVNKILLGYSNDNEQNISYNSELNLSYNEMIRSYLREDNNLQEKIYLYKNKFIDYMNKNVLSRFVNDV
jgi:hypothetical protein